MIRNRRLSGPIARACYLGGVVVFLVIAAVLLAAGSKWYVDALIAVSYLLILWSLNKHIRIGAYGYSLVVLALSLHVLGALDWYDWSYTIGSFVLGYDNVVHTIGAFAAAFVAFNFVVHVLHRDGEHTAHIDEHPFLLLLLVFCLVTALGTGVEVMEFAGSTILGEGAGMLMYGAGDSDTFFGAEGPYADTMIDLFFNTFGAVLGTLMYFFTTYRRRPWLD